MLATPKIWRSGEWVVGVAGVLSHTMIIRNCELPPPMESLRATEIRLSEWMRDVFCDIAEYQRNYGALVGKDAEGNSPQIICATGHSVFCILGGQASRSMRDYAMGSMRALGTTDAGKNQFLKACTAMQCAYTDTDWVWGPVNWLSTTGTGSSFDPSTKWMTEQLRPR